MTNAMISDITVYTDGSCLENSGGGPGGWGYVIPGEKYDIKRSCGFFSTTNNRMEMMAVIEVLLALDTPRRVKIYTDSEYVINGATKWIYGWINRNWVKADETPVGNKDLWLKMIDAKKDHHIEFIKVKAHTGDYYNEMVDVLAKSAARNPTLTDEGYVPTPPGQPKKRWNPYKPKWKK